MLKIRTSLRMDKVLNILFDISFILYIVAYVYYYDDTIDYSGTIRMMATLTILTTGSLEVLKNKKWVKINTYIISYLLFMAFCLLSSIWANDSHLSTSSFTVMLRIVILFVFLNYRIVNDADTERLLNAYIIAVIIVIMIVTKDMINYYSKSTFLLYRFGIVGNNPNIISMLSVFCAIICNHKYKVADKNKLYAGLLVFFVFIIFICQSKKGILGLGLGLFFISYFRNKGNKRLTRVLCVVFLILILYIMLMMVPYFYNRIGYRFDELFDLFSGKSSTRNSTTNRAELILQGFRLWLQHPLWGVGINNFAINQSVHDGAYYYSHCNFVELLSGVGLIGFFLYYHYPAKCIMTRIDIKDDLRITLKTICLLMLFFDIATVNFQEVYVLVFYNFFFICMNRKESSVLNGILA